MARKKSAVEEEAEMNMTPMIDVTFLLLIFFIVTLKFKTLERKLNSYLPTDFGTNASPEIIEEKFVTVKMKQPSVAEAGSDWRNPARTRFYIENELIPGTPVEAIGKIARRLDDFQRQVPEAKGKIDADFGVPHRHVVAVLDTFTKTRYETITFVGLTSNFNIAKSDEWFNKIRARLAAGTPEAAGN